MSGLTPIERLDAALGDAEAGLHLVDDQQHAILVAERAGELDELGPGGDGAAIAHDRLDQHGADMVAVLLEDVLEPVGVVHRRQVHQLLEGLRDALRVGDRLRVAAGPAPTRPCSPSTWRHRRGHDSRPRSGRSCPCRYRRGRGAAPPSPLRCRCWRSGRVRPPAPSWRCARRRRVRVGREGEDAADLHALARRVIDPVVGIAEDRRAVAQAVIDIAIAVDIPECGRPCRDGHRSCAHRPSSGRSRPRRAAGVRRRGGSARSTVRGCGCSAGSSVPPAPRGGMAFGSMHRLVDFD